MPAGLSLLSLVRERFLEAIRGVQPASRWKTIVTDEPTCAAMLNVLKMYDILDENVQQVELIGNPRSANPRVEAIYFLAPTAQNIDRVIRDFLPASAAGDQAITRRSCVRRAHVQGCASLLRRLDDLLNRIANSPAGSALATCKELFLDFWPVEARVFSLRTHQSFWTLYGPASQITRDSAASWDRELSEMAARIVNILATLDELPEIRCYVPPAGVLREPVGPGRAAGEHVAPRLAQRVHEALMQHARNTEGFPRESDPPRPRGILFITDRTMDLFAPFLHEFTYQAMANDVMPIADGTKYHYSFRNEQGVMEDKDAILSDEDKVWTDVRHLHMSEASERLVQAFKAYSDEHGKSGSGINDLKDMLASLPGMRDAKEKLIEQLSLHLSLAEKCMNIFEAKKLPLSASVEQQCATGMTPQGKAPKTLVEEMVPLLDDPSVSRKDKVRIIALYIMHRDGVPEEDRKRLYQHAKLGMPEVDAVNNLAYLGVDVTKDSRSKRKTLFKQPLVEEAFEISRFQPALKLMLEDHFAGKLDRAAFPYIGAPPPPVPVGGSMRSGATAHAAPTAAPASLRSARPRWTAASGKAGSGGGGARFEPPRQRVIVFVAGGMTYSEIRTAYQLSEALGKDVVIGSTHVVTPESFIDDLSNLDRPPPKPRPAPSQAPPQPSNGHGAGLAPPRPQPHHTNSAPDVRPGSSSRTGGGYGEPLHHARSAQPMAPQQQPPRPYGNAPPPSAGYEYGRPNSPRPSVASATSTAASSATGAEKAKKKGLFSRK